MMALGIILAVLVLLLLVPVGLRLGYDEAGLRADVMAGWVALHLYPPKKKQPSPRKLVRRQKKELKMQQKPPKKPPKKSPEKPSRKKSHGELRAILQMAAELLGDMRRKLVVRELYLRVLFGGTDAAQTAIRYGKAWAIIGGTMPLLERMFEIRKRDIAAELDQSKQEPTLTARLDFRLRIGTLLALGLKLGFHFIKILIKQKAVQKNESSSV